MKKNLTTFYGQRYKFTQNNRRMSRAGVQWGRAVDTDTAKPREAICKGVAIAAGKSPK